jgi:hypothetical protein
MSTAARTAVGRSWATSTAKLGPESTTTGRSVPSSCAITSDIRRSVSDSRPFVALTTVACGPMWGAASLSTARQPCEGSAETTSSESPSASDREAVTVTLSGSETSGRYTAFARRAAISATSAGSRAQRLTS